MPQKKDDPPKTNNHQNCLPQNNETIEPKENLSINIPGFSFLYSTEKLSVEAGPLKFGISNEWALIVYSFIVRLFKSRLLPFMKKYHRSLLFILFIACFIGMMILARSYVYKKSDQIYMKGLQKIHEACISEASSILRKQWVNYQQIQMASLALSWYQGNWDTFKKIIEQEKKNKHPFVSLFQGHLMATTNNFAQAHLIYQNIIDNEHSGVWVRSEAYTALGRIQLLEKKPLDAQNAFESAIQLNPSFVMAYTGKGFALEMQQKWKPASQFYLKAMNLIQQTGVDIQKHLLFRITHHLNQMVTQTSDCMDNQECQLKIAAQIDHMLKEARSLVENKELSKHRILMTHLKPKGFVSPWIGHHLLISREIVSHLESLTSIKNINSLQMVGLMKRLTRPLYDIHDFEIAKRLSRLLSASLVISGEIKRQTPHFYIDLKLYNLLTQHEFSKGFHSIPDEKDMREIVHQTIQP